MLKVAHGTVGRTVGRTVVRSHGRKSKFFRLDGLLLFRIITGLRCARCEQRYEHVRRLKTREDLCHKKRRERELLQMKNILNR